MIMSCLQETLQKCFIWEVFKVICSWKKNASNQCKVTPTCLKYSKFNTLTVQQLIWLWAFVMDTQINHCQSTIFLKQRLFVYLLKCESFGAFVSVVFVASRHPNTIHRKKSHKCKMLRTKDWNRFIWHFALTKENDSFDSTILGGFSMMFNGTPKQKYNVAKESKVDTCGLQFFSRIIWWNYRQLSTQQRLNSCTSYRTKTNIDFDILQKKINFKHCLFAIA